MALCDETTFPACEARDGCTHACEEDADHDDRHVCVCGHTWTSWEDD